MRFKCLGMRYSLGFICLLSIWITSCGDSGAHSPQFKPLRLTSSSETFTGLVALAALHPRFPCDDYLRVSSASTSPVMATLWGTFGTDPSCIARYTEQNAHHKHVLYGYLLNGSCRRKGLCLEGEPFKQDSVSEWDARLIAMSSETSAVLTQRVLALRETFEAVANPNTILLLSIELEDNLSPLATTSLINLIKQSWPYEIVHNPLSMGDVVLADLHELHGLQPIEAPCIANLDGLSVRTDTHDPYTPSITPDRALEWANSRCHCHMVLFWHAPLQGLSNGFSPPMGRGFHLSHIAVDEFRKLLALTC